MHISSTVWWGFFLSLHNYDYFYLQLQCRFTNKSQENKIVAEVSSCAGMSLGDATL